MAPRETLFLFTKLFPFGSAEQYLADELPYLCSVFDKVVLVPCELFGEELPARRSLPSDCEVLLLNQEAARMPAARKWGEFGSVFLVEWMRCRSKTWFWKERKRYASVLLHQAHLATIFTGLLQSRYPGERHLFYCYWIHNSAIMLGLMKRRGVIRSFICRGHAIDLYEWDWALVHYIKVLPFFNFIIHRSTRISSISKHGMDYLVKRFPQMAEKFMFSRLGVDDLGMNPYDPGKIFTIVSCGSIQDRKRIYAIAEVIAQMKIPVRWVHFGDGPDSDRVEAIVRDFPATARAELRGFTPNEEIKKFYASETVHIFLNLSEAEGIPVALMEAISFGIPVLATAVYGNPEIANEATGFLVPLNTKPAEIAEMLETFASDPARQAKVRASARDYYSRCFSAPANYKAFAATLRTLP